MSARTRKGEEREANETARHLMARLGKSGGALRRVDGGYLLVGVSLAPAQQDRPVPERLVQLWLRRDWLEAKGRDLVLSAAGGA